MMNFPFWKKKDVFSIVKQPNDKSVLECHWVYKLKRNTNGKIQYKTRIIAKGCNQTFGILKSQ